LFAFDLHICQIAVDSNNQNVEDLSLHRDCFALKMKALRSFETSKSTRLTNGITCQHTNLQQHHCANLRSHNQIILMAKLRDSPVSGNPCLVYDRIF